MKTVKILLLATAIFGLSGCCMKSIEIKPHVNALDLTAAKAGSVGADVKFDLKECCPSKEQEKIALSIQSKITDLYTKLLNDEISIEKYNEKIDAATNAIENVVLVCDSQNKLMKAIPAISSDEAWKELKKVDQEL